MVKRLGLLVLVLGMALVRRPPAVARGPVRRALDAPLQRSAERLFGTRAGAVVVYDLGERAVRALVHPAVASGTAAAPGSLMKLVTAAAMLESGAVPSGLRIRCRNHVTVAGRRFTCGYPGGHGMVDLRAAIARSCSVYFYTVGQRVPTAAELQAGRALGLGQPGGIPSRAGAAGRFRAPRALRDRLLWLVGEGPDVSVTPGQVARMVERIVAPPADAGGLRPATLRFLRAAMRDAVAYGTALPAALPGHAVGGKTGTADRHPDQPYDIHAPRDTSGWFAGYAPADHPRWIVVVYLAHGTGHDAAALAGRILRVALRSAP